MYSQYTIGNRAREIKSRLWWVFIFLKFYVGYSSANTLVIALLFFFFFFFFLGGGGGGCRKKNIKK